MSDRVELELTEDMREVLIRALRFCLENASHHYDKYAMNNVLDQLTKSESTDIFPLDL